MATIPNPRNFSQSLGDLLDGLLSRLGLTDIKPGSPTLNLMEAVAQSDTRVSQDLFTMLAAMALDYAEGQALDRIGAGEGVPRFPASAANGLVTFSDTTFTKTSSRVYAGVAAPIAGTDKVHVEDATTFPATGSVYVGRGTSRYEGPLAYTSKTNMGSYWKLTLAGGSETQNFHNFGESVILAQGGLRAISAGTQAEAPLGGAQAAVAFLTVFPAGIPDGETQVENVLVVAQRRGNVGNVGMGAIKIVSGSPYPGATCTNPLPFSNGTELESDTDYRARIREAVQARTAGTPLSLESGVRGLTSVDEQKRVAAASLVEQIGRATLYIDDGNGYEERAAGVAFETLEEDAIGGERYFQVMAPLPVTKAFLESGLTAPFALVAGASLEVEVGGVLYRHSFSSDQFRDISAATAYEIVASINADSSLGFGARTSGSGTRVVLFAKAATSEDLLMHALVAPDIDANTWLAFPGSRTETLRLYLNDRLLTKDGRRAEVRSQPQSQWLPVTGSAVVPALILSVDSTPSQSVYVTDADFVAEGSYTSVAASNSLASWAAVLETLIPGVTVETSGGQLSLVSNRGRSARAALTVTGGTLVTAGQFWTAAQGLTDVGENQDYQFNRSTGQVRLESVLAATDRLTVGTLAPRAFLESLPLGTVDLVADAELWFCVDGQPEFVTSGLLPSQTLSLAIYNPTPDWAWGEFVRVTANSGTPFSNVQTGDWAVFLDTNLNATNRGAFRVAEVVNYAHGTVTFAAAIAADNVTVGATTFVGTAGAVTPGAATYSIDTGNTAAAASLAAQINAHAVASTVVSATSTGAICVIQADTAGTAGNAIVFTSTNGTRLAVTGAGTLAGAGSFDIERPTLPNPEALVPMTGGGIVFIRTKALLQKVTIPAAVGYTAATLATSMATQLRGAVAETWQTSKIRIRTHGAGATGGIALVARNSYGAQLLLEPEIQDNLIVVAPASTSAWAQDRIPTFSTLPVTVVAGSVVTAAATSGVEATFTDSLIWNRELPDIDGSPATRARYGTNAHFLTALESVAPAGAMTIRGTPPLTPVTGTVLYAAQALTANGEDLLSVSVDAESPFSIPVFRRLKATTGTYGTVNTVTDADNANASLALAFGTGFNFQDFRVLMHARTKSHAEAGDTTKTVLWRAKTWGATGQHLRVRYTAPTAPSDNVAISPDAYVTTDDQVTHVNVRLGAGAARAASAIRTTTRVGVSAAVSGGLTALKYTLGYSVSSASRTTGVTTATLNIAAKGHADHGLQINDRVWIQSTDVNFTSGPKVVTGRAAATITYAEGLADIGATANIGTLSFDSAGEATFDGTIIVGDIAAWAGAPLVTAGYRQTQQISAVTDSQQIITLSEIVVTPITTPVWELLSSATAFQAYPLDAAKNTAAAIATSVNLLTDVPVTAVAVGLAGVATGVIASPSFREFGVVNYGYTLTDGVNAIKSHTTPPDTATNFVFTFKAAVTAGLAGNSDWANEDLRLVPSTANNIRDFLACKGVSGLSSVAEVQTVGESRQVQVLSLGTGSSARVQVGGGSANNGGVSIVGGVTTVGTAAVVEIPSANSNDVVGGAFVELVNSMTLARPSVITSATRLSSRDTSGNCVLSTTQAWTAARAAVNGKTWQVEPQGQFVAYRWSGTDAVAADLTGLTEGDYVLVTGTGAARNQGLFRIVRVSTATKTFWVDNPSYLEELQGGVYNLLFLDGEASILPGDQLLVGTGLWGTDFQGAWTVESIDSTSVYKFKLAGAFTAFTGPVALGAASPLVQVREGAPSRLIKKVLGQNPGPTSGLTQVRLSDSSNTYWIGANAGTLIRPLGKLEFPTTLNLGLDGYSHSLGLIAEAAKVLYGDRADPATYPGLVAANSVVDISGPVIKRLRLGFAVRVRSQFSPEDVVENFRSAIAAAVNRNPQGRALPFVGENGLLSAGEGVSGVDAITVLSPTYGPGNDRISVQPEEKLLILDPAADILVTLVGE